MTVQDSQLIFLFTLRALICAEWNEPVGAEEVEGKSIKRVLKCASLDAADSESENTSRRERMIDNKRHVK